MVQLMNLANSDHPLSSLGTRKMLRVIELKHGGALSQLKSMYWYVIVGNCSAEPFARSRQFIYFNQYARPVFLYFVVIMQLILK